MPRVATIGVYGWTLETFLDALAAAGVTVVADVRQRRGVRGGEYAWANARRLEDALRAAGFAYRHHPELAPTTELRQLQYAEDDRLGVRKRSRVRLAPSYRRRYVLEILRRADLGGFGDGVGGILCVERDPEACHRSLIAERLAQHGYDVTDLRPAITGDGP